MPSAIGLSRRAPGRRTLAARVWNVQGHRRTLFLHAGDVDASPDEVGPLAHAQQSESVWGGLLSISNPSAVITDREDQCSPCLLQHDFDPGRVRVTEHVGQGFL